jgi:hypothetical protein
VEGDKKIRPHTPYLVQWASALTPLRGEGDKEDLFLTMDNRVSIILFGVVHQTSDLLPHT